MPAPSAMPPLPLEATKAMPMSFRSASSPLSWSSLWSASYEPKPKLRFTTVMPYVWALATTHCRARSIRSSGTAVVSAATRSATSFAPGAMPRYVKPPVSN